MAKICRTKLELENTFYSSFIRQFILILTKMQLFRNRNETNTKLRFCANYQKPQSIWLEVIFFFFALRVGNSRP